jgi:hypothetical protein
MPLNENHRDFRIKNPRYLFHDHGSLWKGPGLEMSGKIPVFDVHLMILRKTCLILLMNALIFGWMSTCRQKTKHRHLKRSTVPRTQRYEARCAYS